MQIQVKFVDSGIYIFAYQIHSFQDKQDLQPKMLLSRKRSKNCRWDHPWLDDNNQSGFRTRESQSDSPCEAKGGSRATSPQVERHQHKCSQWGSFWPQTPRTQRGSFGVKTQANEAQPANLKVAGWSLPGIATTLVVLLMACLAPLSSAQAIVCGQESWFYGVSTDLNYEFQAMDSSEDGSTVVVGGYDSNGAIFIAHDMETGTTLRHLTISETNFAVLSYAIEGVVGIKMHVSENKAYALLKLHPDAYPNNVIALTYFSFDGNTDVSVIQFANSLVDYTLQLFPMAWRGDKIQFLIVDNSASDTKITRLLFNTAGGNDRVYTAIESKDEQMLTLGDAIVNDYEKFFMALNLDGKNEAVLIYHNSNLKSQTDDYLVIEEVAASAAEYKLVPHSDQDLKVFFVSKNDVGTSVNIYECDRDYNLLEVNDSWFLSFDGVASMTIQSAYQDSNFDVIVVASTATGYIIVSNASTKVTIVTVDRSLTPQPWVFSVMPLLGTMGTSNSCQYGFSLSHIERLCITASSTGSTPCGSFVTKSTTSGDGSWSSVNESTDKVELEESGFVDNSVSGITAETQTIANLDISKPLEKQIIDPCGILPIKFLDDETVILNHASGVIDMKYLVSQTAVGVDEMCPDSTTPVVTLDSDYVAGYIDHLIDPLGNQIVPTSGEVTFNAAALWIELNQGEAILSVSGDWQVVYTLGYSTGSTFDDWPYVSTQHSTTFQVILCEEDLTAPFSRILTPLTYDPAEIEQTYLYAFDNAGNANCQFSYTLVSVSPAPPSNAFNFEQPTFDSATSSQYSVVDHGNIKVTPTVDMIGTTYALQFEINGESTSLSFTFYVEILGLICSENPLFDRITDSPPPSYTFTADDSTEQEIPLNYFTNGDCSFELAISDAGDSHAVPLSFTIDQPAFSFTPDNASPIVDTIVSQGKLRFVASYAAIGLHSALEVTIVGQPTASYVFSIEVTVIDCTKANSFTLPTFAPLYTAQQGTPTDISLGPVTQDGSCSYSFYLDIDSVSYTSALLPTQVYQDDFSQDFPGNVNGPLSVVLPSQAKITISATLIDHCNIPGEFYTFEVTVTNSVASATSSFQVFVEGALCQSSPILPVFDEDYTFTYDRDAGVYEIGDLTLASNGDCEYELEFSFSTSPLVPLVTLDLPTFRVPEPKQPNVVVRGDAGKLEVQPNDISHIGSYTVTLSMIDGPSKSFDLIIEAPVCVPNLLFPIVQDVETFADDAGPITLALQGSDGDCVFEYTVIEQSQGGDSDPPARPIFELSQPTFDTETQIATIATSLQAASLNITPSLDHIGEHQLDITIKSLATTDTILRSITVKVLAPLCTSTIITPDHISTTITVDDPEKVIEFAEISDDLCHYELTLVQLTGEQASALFSLDQPSYTLLHELTPDLVNVSEYGRLRIATPTKAEVGVYSLQIQVTDSTSTTEEFLVTVEVLQNGTCDADLQVPSIIDQEMEMSSNEVTIFLEGAGNGSCRFTYELVDEDYNLIDPSLFAVEQPTFIGEGNERVIQNPGRIIVTPNQLKHVGTYTTLLLLQGQDGSTGVVTFEVNVVACEAINAIKETTIDVSYEIGGGEEIVKIPKANQDCPATSFFFNSDGSVLPKFITLDEGALEIRIETQNVDNVGEYLLESMELDIFTLKTVKTFFNIQVKVNTNTTETEEEDVSVPPQFTPDYLKKKYGYVPTEKVVEPLTAQIYDITKTGNLTIIFNKPIILPPIDVFKEYQGNRQLQSGVNDNDGTSQKFKNYSLSEVLQIRIDSAYYEDDDKEIELLKYNLTRLTPTALDIQIIFKEPQSITLSRVEPDLIQVEFKLIAIFMDKQDFKTFEENSLILEYPVVPQYSKERLEELEAIETVIGSTITTFSISNFILNIFLAFGLKYLWNMVTLLQFMVFMRQWLVVLPDEADIFLKMLKSLALFEFLPTEEINDIVMDWFGIEDSKNSLKEDQTLFEKFAVFLLAGLVILFLVLFLLMLRLCVRTSPRANRWYTTLKAKLFYNTFIRYVLLGTLKIQMTIGGAILIGSVIDETPKDQAPSTGFLIFGICVLVSMTLVPALFAWVLRANKGNLGKDDIKNKIGALYFSFIPDKPYMGSYSVIFMLRRSFFVLITFGLYSYPSMQVECMLYSTMLYVCYISKMGFYESKSHRRVEVMNECILIGVCYHFVIFANPSFDISIRHKLGYSIITFVCFLLFVNLIVIIGVNIETIKRKLMLKRMKREAKERIAARYAASQEAQAQKKRNAVEGDNNIVVVVKKSNNTGTTNIASDMNESCHQNGDRKIPVKSKKPIKGASMISNPNVDIISGDPEKIAAAAVQVDKLESFSVMESPVVGASLQTHPTKPVAPQPATMIVKSTGKGKKQKKGKSLKMAKSNTRLATKKKTKGTYAKQYQFNNGSVTETNQGKIVNQFHQPKTINNNNAPATATAEAQPRFGAATGNIPVAILPPPTSIATNDVPESIFGQVVSLTPIEGAMHIQAPRQTMIENSTRAAQGNNDSHGHGQSMTPAERFPWLTSVMMNPIGPNQTIPIRQQPKTQAQIDESSKQLFGEFARIYGAAKREAAENDRS